MRPHRRQPTRLPRPWDSPGKITGVGCHFLLQCMKVKRESEVAQLCWTVCDPMDCSLPGSSVHGIFQGRVLEWGAMAFSGSESYIVLNSSFFWKIRTTRWVLETTEYEVLSHSTRLNFYSCLNQTRFNTLDLKILACMRVTKNACMFRPCLGYSLALCTSLAQPLPAHLHPTHILLTFLVNHWL